MMYNIIALSILLIIFIAYCFMFHSKTSLFISGVVWFVVKILLLSVRVIYRFKLDIMPIEQIYESIIKQVNILNTLFLVEIITFEVFVILLFCKSKIKDETVHETNKFANSNNSITDNNQYKL